MYTRSLRKLASICLVLVALGWGAGASAQDLTTVGQKDALKVNGSLATQQLFYHGSGLNVQRDPYTYYMTGNLVFSLYGWSVPFSYTYSNQQHAFQQPFNQYSLHPQYKWIKAHMGYTSMSFSPYTLSGHQFVGGGVELTPGDKWQVALMYGRLRKAIGPDSTNYEQVAFRRMGYGLKTAYKADKGFVELSLFRGSDDGSSVSVPVDSLEVTPEENLVVGLKSGATFLQSLKIQVEYAVSALTTNTRAAEGSACEGEVFQYSLGMFTPRQSSAYYHAMNTAVSYQLKSSRIGVKYERIDPGYKTHGAYYFNNDLENISVDMSTSLWQQRVSVSGRMGIQRDDLDGQKATRMTRTVGSANMALNLSKKWQMQMSYSNFQSYMHIKNQLEEITRVELYADPDTLSFTQISESANVSTSYVIRNTKENRQQLTLQGAWQQASQEQDDGGTHAGNQFYNLNAGYHYQLLPLQMNVSVAVNGSLNKGQGIETSTLGPTVSVGKQFLEKKLRTRLSTALNYAYVEDQQQSAILNVRLNNSYTWRKKHAFQLSMMLMSRESLEGKKMNEFTATFGYNYNFGF